VLSELGVSYSYTNELVDAKNTYENSYKILKEINNKEKLSNISANIASIYSQLYNYPVSLSYYKMGLEYAGENINSKIINLRGIGDVHANLSNYSKALEYYNKAKELSASIKNIDLESSVDMSIGTLYYNINKIEKAIETFLKIERRSDKINDPYLAEDLNFKIGLCYTDLKNYNKAKEFYNKGLLISQTQQDIYYQILISGELAYSEYLNNNNVEAKKILVNSINQSNVWIY
jgi:tetratricopeptide (TPR) repeat protein